MRADHSWATRIAAGAALSAALVLMATPAFAHDELVSSDPAANARLSSMPEIITLTYSGELMELGVAVEVRDSDGADHTLGEPEVGENVVTVSVDPASVEGSYSVVWRVVSSDGHPISGSVPFTVGDATAGDGEPSAAPVSTATEPSAIAPTPSDPTVEAGTSTTEASVDSESLWAPGGWARVTFVAVAGAALALGLLIVGITIGHRRTRADDPQHAFGGHAAAEQQLEKEHQ